MKPIKTLGIAMVMAIAAMVVLNSGTALADTACLSEEFEAECAKENIIPNGTTIKAEQTGAVVILGPPEEVKCKKSSATGKVIQNTGEAVLTEFLSWTFLECSGCKKVTAEGLPWSIQMRFLSYDPMTEQQQDEWVVHNPKVKLSECGKSNLTCTMSAKEIVLAMHVTPTETVVVAEEVGLEMSGLGCGKEAELTATYKVSEPTPLWISEA